MGNFFDKLLNGPPFAPQCDPECVPGPDNRGIQCYKGKCVPNCPIDSTMVNGKCSCQEGLMFVDQNLNNQDPVKGEGWGYCKSERIQKIKEQIKYRPESIFIEKIPIELDNRVKEKIKKKLKENPNMTEVEIKNLTSRFTNEIIQELAIECKEEYKIMETILSKKYGNGKWPTRDKLKILIKNKNFPWRTSDVNFWPEEQEILSCRAVSKLKEKIERFNKQKCEYSKEYTEIVDKCNVKCGKGVEERQKKIIKSCNIDFPPFVCEDVNKKFICNNVCPEDCKYDVNEDPEDDNSFLTAQCSQSCDYGNGPGEKTYEVTYRQHPKNGGTCDIKDWEYKSPGDKILITEPCNEQKCDFCKIDTKIPYKDEYVDYTDFEKQSDGTNKVYSKCLINGKGKHIDCGGKKVDFNYSKGARTKYDVTYNVTKDYKGIQNCIKGDDVIEEECPKIAKDINGEDILDINGNPILGGGDTCPDTCEIIGFEKVGNCSKKCTDEEGPGKQKMKSVIKPGTSSAANCLCRTNPEECTWEVDCNTKLCDKPCIYVVDDDGNPVREQVNDLCPGKYEGENEHVKNRHIRWDTIKQEWYNIKTKETYPLYKKDKDGNFLKDKNDNKIATFVKDMRVPTLKPPFGKGTCHDTPSTKHLIESCPIDGTGVRRPIPGKWGEWVLKGDVKGQNTTVQIISETHSNWTQKEIILTKIDKLKVGKEVVGSGTIDWPEDDDINKVLKEVKELGHIPNKTVSIINKKDGKIKLYEKDGSINDISGDIWEFSEGRELNPNVGRKGRPCVDFHQLGLSNVVTPAKHFRRDYIEPKYDGLDLNGPDFKEEPFLKDIQLEKLGKGTKIGKKIIIGSGKFDWPQGEDLEKVIDIFREIRHKIDVEVEKNITEQWHLIKYIEKSDKGKMNFYLEGNENTVDSTNVWEIKYGDWNYCPADGGSRKGIKDPSLNWNNFKWDETKCSSEGYTEEELIAESKRKFVRDISLPLLPSKDWEQVGKNQIVGKGTRTIYKIKNRYPVPIEHVCDRKLDKDYNCEEYRYGGMPMTRWHDNVGSTTKTNYDFRPILYEECSGVEAILDSINKSKSSENPEAWKKDFLNNIKAKPCKPVYEWDDKIYFNETTDTPPSLEKSEEEIISPEAGEVEDLYKPEPNPDKPDDAYYPQKYVASFGKYYQVSSYKKGFTEPHLTSLKGWTPRTQQIGEYIQIKTKSEKIENIKGVVIKGNHEGNYHVKSLKIIVSRNGNSWKTVESVIHSGSKAGLNSLSKKFSNSDVWEGTKSSEERHYEKKIYFRELEEAVYIRFLPQTWGGGGIGLRVGYIKGDQREAICTGGSGRTQGEYWYHLKFNEKLTKDNGYYHQGHADGQLCPSDKSSIWVKKNKDGFFIEGDKINPLYQINIDGQISNLQGKIGESKFLLKDCGVEPNTQGWRNNLLGTSLSWSECRKPDEETGLPNWKLNKFRKSGKSNLKMVTEEECQTWADDNPNAYAAPEGLGGTWDNIPQGCVINSDGKTHYNRSESGKDCGSGGYNCVEPSEVSAVCKDDNGYQYMYNRWNTKGQNTNNLYKKIIVGHTNVQDFDDSSKNWNVIRKTCFRDTCHKLPELEPKSNNINSTHCSTAGESYTGYRGTIVNIKKLGIDGSVKGILHTLENRYQNKLIPILNKHICDEDNTNNCDGSTNPESWKLRKYYVRRLLGSKGKFTSTTENSVTFNIETFKVWTVVGFDLIVCSETNISKRKKKTPEIIFFDPLTKDNQASLASIKSREDSYWKIKIPSETQPNQKITYLFKPSMREEISAKGLDNKYLYPKMRFAGTRGNTGTKGLSFKIALYYGVEEYDKNGKLTSYCFEKGSSGCTHGNDPVNCKMDTNKDGTPKYGPWGHYNGDGVFTSGVCSNDPTGEKSDKYGGLKCAYPGDAPAEGPRTTTGKDTKSGEQFRIRGFSEGKHGGDNTCKKERQDQPCNTAVCPMDCRGEWSDWQNSNSISLCERVTDAREDGKCEYKCDGKFRYYSKTLSKRGNGNDCPYENDYTEYDRGAWRTGIWRDSPPGGGGSECPDFIEQVEELVEDPATQSALQSLSAAPAAPAAASGGGGGGGGCIVM